MSFPPPGLPIPGFPWPEAGTPLADVATPLPVIDEDRLATNIARAQDYMAAHGLNFRPHIKTHKIAAVARQQITAGAVGINCQKLTEAEAFADAGFDDILITYNILGPVRVARLLALNARVTRLAVTTDSAVTVAGLAAAFPAEKPLTVLVECDTGGGRCGVQSAADAFALAQLITAAPGLNFGGLMTYPGPGGAARVEAFLQETMALLAQAGLPCPMRTNGGSPDLWKAHLVPSATEHRAGTYVYNDRSMVRAGACGPEDLAMHVLATVVSRPTPVRAVLDCGSKTLTSDLLGFTDYGEIEGLAGARITSLSEEHAVVDLSACTSPLPQVGDLVRVVPNHTCVVSNLFDRMVFHKNGVVTRVEPLAARGTVW
ncbi:D-TA family PLP-dependent enzyme [Rhodobacter sp. 24-YEA-8]|uniref:D-TA family PLP-dependent enzyme n=1 Tax=Rhodobacter sp. 24-YEA-8 TaxID=1884310 RepID=UPI00089431A0|nr:D-TA family PLP-dependent enzyme [Rhodobacter sp. 24-YEA-8]SEC70589.1 D-serine deaminase, pyridoxal phosphate-dependent [Rhodobacter sp. 24-YEA-8]